MMKMLMLVNTIKSLKNSQKKINTDLFKELSQFEYKGYITLNKKSSARYSKFIEWNGPGIHPIYPYSLLTAIQFQIANVKSFPFSPYGLIHKKEKISCLKPLVFGEAKVHSFISEFREIKNGYEFDVQSDLSIADELYWSSVTTIFKRTRVGVAKRKTESPDLTKSLTWKVPRGHGLRYGLISMNLDLIHISKLTAKLMGHKQAIMHGMWGVARGVSELRELSYPFTLETQFKSPIFLPSTVQFAQSSSGFNIYSEKTEKIHLTSQLISL